MEWNKKKCIDFIHGFFIQSDCKFAHNGYYGINTQAKIKIKKKLPIEPL